MARRFWIGKLRKWGIAKGRIFRQIGGMDDDSLVDFSMIDHRRKRAEEERYLEVVRQADGPIGSYEVATQVGVPAHSVYPRLLQLVEKGKLQMPANDEFQVA